MRSRAAPEGCEAGRGPARLGGAPPAPRVFAPRASSSHPSGGLLRPGQSAADAVIQEKLREDAIREEGWNVLRWVWADLDPFDELAARLRRRLR